MPESELSPSVRFAREINAAMAAGKDYMSAYVEVKKLQPDLFEAMDREGRIAAANSAARLRPAAICVNEQHVSGTKAILKVVSDKMKATNTDFATAYDMCRRQHRHLFTK